jgi:hypothetical protein
MSVVNILKPTERQEERNVEGVGGYQETPLLLGRRGGTGENLRL